MSGDTGLVTSIETVLDDWLEPAAILVFNTVPVAGVLVWDWNLAAIMVLYWLENGVVGLLNVPKILLASRSMDGSEVLTGEGILADLDFGESGILATVPLIGFFGFHYGVFWVVHGMFVIVLFVIRTPVELLAALPTVMLALLALTAQRGFETYFEFYRPGRHRTVTPQEQTVSPYRRVVILHVTLVFGGFVVFLIGAPVGALVLLVVLKTGYDLGAWGWTGGN